MDTIYLEGDCFDCGHAIDDHDQRSQPPECIVGCDCGEVGRCPACGDPTDYCTGHGPIGDPIGAAILAAHNGGNHAGCSPDGCVDAGTVTP